MEWVEIKLEVSPSLVEAVSNRLFEIGAQGVTEAGTVENPVLIAYFEKKDAARVKKEIQTYSESLKALHPGSTISPVQEKDVEDSNWKDKYKEFYKAQSLSPNFYLLPAWDNETKPPPESIVIRMEPGQAFGTGLHPSTRMSLHLIEEVIKRSPNPEVIRSIDVGTGTGILAIVLEKLNVKQIDAIDNDPVAVEAALENAEQNNCKRMKCSADPLSKVKGPYDLVVSNILLETHRELFAEYARLTTQYGYLILSGLLGPQKGDVFELAERFGFKFLMQLSFQEWTAFLFAQVGRSK